MLVNIIGVNCRKGTSEKNGKQYCIAEVIYSVPDESGFKNDSDGKPIWVYTAYGNKTRSLPLNPDRIHDFKDVVPGAEIDLVLEPNPENPARNWVVGSK